MTTRRDFLTGTGAFLTGGLLGGAVTNDHPTGGPDGQPGLVATNTLSLDTTTADIDDGVRSVKWNVENHPDLGVSTVTVYGTLFDDGHYRTPVFVKVRLEGGGPPNYKTTYAFGVENHFAATFAAPSEYVAEDEISIICVTVQEHDQEVSE